MQPVAAPDVSVQDVKAFIAAKAKEGAEGNSR